LLDAVALILKLLDLFEAGSIAYERIAEIRAKLETMKAEGRDPTPEEWDALFADIDKNSQALDEADRRLNP
jgi:hypothetical protein